MSVGGNFLNALANNENLGSVHLNVLGPNGDTTYSYVLTNASISARQVSHTGAVGDSMLEQITLSFQKLEETFTTGGISASVDSVPPA